MSDSSTPNTPTSTRMLRKTLILTGWIALGIAIVWALIGWLVDGRDGLISGLAGVGLAVIFLAVTPVSMLVANRFFRSEMFAQIFFAIVMGGWLLKFVVFFVAIAILRDQPWLSPTVLFLAMVSGIAASLAIDVMAFTRMRVPYVDVDLPQRDPDDESDS